MIVDSQHGLDIADIINRAISSDCVYDLSDNANLIVFQVEYRANSDLNFVAGGCVVGETRDLHSRSGAFRVLASHEVMRVTVEPSLELCSGRVRL